MPTLHTQSGLRPSDQPELPPVTVTYHCISRPLRRECVRAVITQMAPLSDYADLCMVINTMYKKER